MTSRRDETAQPPARRAAPAPPPGARALGVPPRPRPAPPGPQSNPVYASPSRRKMDTKGDGEEMTYPHICFMVDNFDEVSLCDEPLRLMQADSSHLGPCPNTINTNSRA
ncbi:unnamed protein product [Plutella xylostella]|uniref:(diamondback moth) hypothetical protein n=1 Tax=Plutella xylostella TaxID=51655 RepID=A0A8S4D0X0_PLUXY|nr:unnamed protein product [Plutella xylostella]